MHLQTTSLSLLSRLRDEGDHAGWHVSEKRFLELYLQPHLAMACSIYRTHSGHAAQSQQAIEDLVASVVVGFFKKDRFDAERGGLRTNGRIVDILRKGKCTAFQRIVQNVEKQFISSSNIDSKGSISSQ